MPRLVALLRGINVSGQKLVKMADLRSWIGELGYSDVETYIQSGNVVFTTPTRSTTRVARAVADAIRHGSGFDVSVTVRTGRELDGIVKRNPFPEVAEQSPKLLHVAFLEKKPSRAALARLEQVESGSDRFQAEGAHLYVHYPNGSARSKLDNPSIERSLAMRSTARNWNTVLRLCALVAGA